MRKLKLGACYIRVSTTEQTEYSPESQLRLIREYADKNNILISDGHIYRDEGISGRSAKKRSEFQRMIAAAKQKEFEVILVYSTSRFARNLEDSIVYKSMLQRECEVEVISITQPSVDKKTDMLTNAIYAVMDEWYSLDLSDNVKRGMTQKALEGGRQTAPPLGYSIEHKDAIMKIKEDEAEIIRFIFDRYNSGVSRWAISREALARGYKTKKGYNISVRNLDYILHNPAYKGYVQWTPSGKKQWDFKNKNTIVARGLHEPIISEQLFDNVQKKLDKAAEANKRKSRPVEETKHWLSGILKCSNCGSSLTYNGISATKKTPSFRCGGYNKGFCTIMNYITVDKAEESLFNYLKDISSDITALYHFDIEKTAQDPNEIKFLETKIQKLMKKSGRAKMAFLDGVFEIDEYKKIKEDSDREISKLEERLLKLKDSRIEYGDLQRSVANMYEILTKDVFNKEEKQLAVRGSINKIVVNKKSGEFRIYFYC